MVCRCCLEVNKTDLLDGVIDITNLETLYKTIINPALREIRMDISFAELFFTPTGLTEFIISVQQLNEFVQIYVDDKYLAKELEVVRLMGNVKTFDDVLNLCFNNRDIIVRTIKEMCNSINMIHTNELQYSNRLNSSNLQRMELEKTIENREADLYHLRRDYNELRYKYDILTARIKYQHGIPLDDKNWLEILDEDNRYKRILYIKEITRVKYVDSFLHYVNQTLMSLYNSPVRNVVIEAAGAYERSILYPGFMRHNELSIIDIISADIYMYGFQSNLMKDILKNPERVNFLIILDRGMWHKPHISGSRVELVYTISDLEDIRNLSVTATKNRVISYSPDTLFIPHSDDFVKMSSEERIQYYSSTKIMREIINMLEL